jgi:histidyl-tRNA synthetase
MMCCPAEIGVWQHVERIARSVFEAYGYEELRVPVVEHTELFKRSIGEFTDIVEKEMYTFQDLGGDSLTLRPEATAGIVRAAISNGMLRGARHKLWCMGPMFRHERPQKGRYRQFYQMDLEAIGFEGPDVDVELIALTARLWRELKLTRVRLQINSLGTPQRGRSIVSGWSSISKRMKGSWTRTAAGVWGAIHCAFWTARIPHACVIESAPRLSDFLDPESQAHFAALKAGLDALGVAYEVNPRLVRGLDYYSRTVFEWVTDALGARRTRCARAGRYDGLAAQLGGEPTPAIGFAMGDRAGGGSTGTGWRQARRRSCTRGLYRRQRRAGGARGTAACGTVARCAAGARRAAQSGRRQLQDAVSARRSQRRASGADPGGRRARSGRGGGENFARRDGQIDCPLDELAARIASWP